VRADLEADGLFKGCRFIADARHRAPVAAASKPHRARSMQPWRRLGARTGRVGSTDGACNLDEPAASAPTDSRVRALRHR